MLNPKLITDAVASTLAAIPALAAAMTATDQRTLQVGTRITAFHYRLGEEHRLAQAVYEMPAPSMLVVWDGTMPGQADGQTLFKHRIDIYMRMGNAVGLPSPVGYEDLWWMVCNGIPAGQTQNIRYLNILPGLEIMDTPAVAHVIDEEQFDRFKSTFVIPEIGDQ